MSVAEALRGYMSEIPAAELKEVYVPHTQIEHLHGVTPKLCSEAVGRRARLGMAHEGNVGWTVNLAGTELYSTSSRSAFAEISAVDMQARYKATSRQRLLAKRNLKAKMLATPLRVTKKPASTA